MAVKTIEIDTRIKSAPNSTVLNYNGTLYILDNNGIKFFNGSELVLINSPSIFPTAHGLVYGDYIYFLNNSKYLCRYNITNNTTETTSLSIDSRYVPFDMLRYGERIYIFSSYETSNYYYVQCTIYDAENNVVVNDDFRIISLGRYAITSRNQIIFNNDKMYFFHRGTLRTFDLPDLTTTVVINANLETRYDSGLYIYNDNIVCTLGRVNASAGDPTNTFYEYDLNTRLTNTIDINIEATESNCKTNYVGLWDDAYCIATPSGLIKIRYVTYNLTYNFYDYKGSNLLNQIKDKYPITSLIFNQEDNNISYVLTTLDGVVSGGFEYIAPAGKRVTGMSLNPNSKKPNFIFGLSYDVSIYEDINFYISEGVYRPPSEPFEIELYQNSAEVNRVDKGTYLVGIGTLSGALREECSMLTPSIVYQSSDVPNFNYVYIPIFNRYYFVTSLSSVSKNVWRMELNCDVLMSYKNEILLLQGVVGRQEIDFNPMLVDSELPTQDNPEVEIVNIPSTAFLSHTNITGNLYNFVLTVIG